MQIDIKCILACWLFQKRLLSLPRLKLVAIFFFRLIYRLKTGLIIFFNIICIVMTMIILA